MARRFPRAWLHLWSAHLNGDFASFELSRVRAEEHTLIAMLHEIEALLVAESIPDKYESDGDGVWPTSLRYSIPQRSTAEANRRWYAISCDHVLQRLHNDIVAVMEGRAASLGH